MKLKNEIFLTTALIITISLFLVLVTLNAFFVYVTHEEMKKYASQTSSIILEDLQKCLDKPLARYDEKGNLISSENIGIEKSLILSFFHSTSSGGFFWVEKQPYIWLRQSNVVSLFFPFTLTHIKQYTNWIVLLVSFPRGQILPLHNPQKRQDDILKFLTTHQEKLLSEGDVPPVLQKDFLWQARVITPGLILVSGLRQKLFSNLLKHLFYIGGTGLLVSLVLFWFLFRSQIGSFFRTWEAFLEGVQHFEQEDYHYRIPLSKNTSQELQQTIVAFNNLAETLEASYYANDKLFQQLRYSYYHDKLTGLPNGNQFLEDFFSFESPNLFLFDIENFSEWNMYFGSAVGDRVLEQTAKRLANLSIYPKTSLYKLWADRFLLVIDQPMERRELEIIATYFLENLSSISYEIEGQQIYLTFIAGILGANLLAPGIEGNAVLTAMAGLLKKAKGMKTTFFIAEDIQTLSLSKIKKTSSPLENSGMQSRTPTL
ncbi:GGDEF domain-containing protein [Thermospira aquatica]|uniref:GGDEF domain-containing protein n=1 Tax=Thermospira aquatica TaxID=2828656 RepID=A0AAX3BIF0_9SPIR|nr:GGDEF domain-containing protein [Thermospira aquatica]URA11146.1 GGDEF domain-containing protein [Thermospira aquatica]